MTGRFFKNHRRRVDAVHLIDNQMARNRNTERGFGTGLCRSFCKTKLTFLSGIPSEGPLCGHVLLKWLNSADPKMGCEPNPMPSRHAVHMTHFSARTDIFFAVEMDEDSRLFREGFPSRDFVANEVRHLDAMARFCPAERPARNGAHMLFELIRAACILGPMPRVMNARRLSLIHI